MILYILLVLAGLLMVFFGVMGALGSRLPATHVAKVTASILAPPERVFALIEDVPGMPAWLPDITKVETLEPKHGRPVYRQHMGRNAFVTEEPKHEPGRRIYREITDANGPFTGSWDHLVEPGEAPNATRLTMTETGTIASAIPRAFLHYFFGEDYYLKRFVQRLKVKAEGA